MKLTVGELKNWIDTFNVSDETEIWIEYPKRYGLVTDAKVITHFGDNDSDFIECLSIGGGAGKDKDKLYLFHHY